MLTEQKESRAKAALMPFALQMDSKNIIHSLIIIIARLRVLCCINIFSGGCSTTMYCLYNTRYVRYTTIYVHIGMVGGFEVGYGTSELETSISGMTTLRALQSNFIADE